MKTKAQLWQEASAIIDAAQAEERGLTEAERRAYEKLIGQMEALDHEERAAELLRPRRDVRMLPGYNTAPAPRGNALTRSQSLADHAKLTPEQRGLSFGKYIKGLVTGNWQGAEEERAMSIGTPSAGGYLIPTPLAANIIDLARNKARVFQAGAQTIPMQYSTLKIARVTGDPTAAWHSEAGTITPTDGALDVVTLTAKTLTSLVKFSRELFEDVDNLDAMLTHMFSMAMALELDRVCLYGSGTPPEPTGLIAAGVSTTSMGTNGGQLVNYDPFADAIFAVENANFEPNAAIFSPRTQQTITKLKDQVDNPLQVPKDVADLAFLDTKQVSDARTQGTASNASDIFVGDWSNLLVGMRIDFNVQLVDQRYVDNGQLALLAWLRADVQQAHLGAFNAVVGIIP